MAEKKLQLIQNNEITIAGIILLGTSECQKKYLPYAEIRFGYKLSDKESHNQDTKIYNGGYLLYSDEIWKTINNRNITLHIPQGMRVLEKESFDEEITG